MGEAVFCLPHFHFTDSASLADWREEGGGHVANELHIKFSQAGYSLYLRFGGVWCLLRQRQCFSDGFLEDCHIDVEAFHAEVDFLEKGGPFVEVADSRNYERYDESRKYAYGNILCQIVAYKRDRYAA